MEQKAILQKALAKGQVYTGVYERIWRWCARCGDQVMVKDLNTVKTTAGQEGNGRF